MLTNTNTIFCENIYQLADQRYFVAGVYPGRINLPPGIAIPSFVIKALMQFESDKGGKIPTDIRLLDVTGEMVMQQTMPFEIPNADDMITLALETVVPNRGSGILHLQYRTAEVNWTECGRLRVFAPFVPSSAPPLAQ